MTAVKRCPGCGKVKPASEFYRRRRHRLSSNCRSCQPAAALATRLAGTNVDVIRADATAMPVEGGRFTGAVSFTMLHHVPSAHLQDRLFAEVARVLRPGATFVASDSVASDELAALHHDDVYNPVDPATVADRLTAAGFGAVDVRANEFGWAAHGVR